MRSTGYCTKIYQQKDVDDSDGYHSYASRYVELDSPTAELYALRLFVRAYQLILFSIKHTEHRNKKDGILIWPTGRIEFSVSRKC